MDVNFAGVDVMISKDFKIYVIELNTFPGFPIEADFLGIGEEAFEYQGAKAVHVYLNGVDVTPTGKWLSDPSNVNVMQALAPGDTIQVYVHYEYSFKGEKYTDPDVSSWFGENYIFESDILSAYGPTWSNTLSAVPIIN